MHVASRVRNFDIFCFELVPDLEQDVALHIVSGSNGTQTCTSANELNQYPSITPIGGSPTTIAYDANGNLTSDGVNTFAYDPENRLLSVSGGARTTYAYDALDRRMSKTTGGVTTRYLHGVGKRLWVKLRAQISPSRAKHCAWTSFAWKRWTTIASFGSGIGGDEMNAYVSQALDWLFDPSSRYLVLSIVILLQGAAFIYSRQMRTRAEARLAGAAIESVYQTALAVEAQVAKRADSTALDYPTTRMAPGDDDAPPVSRSQLEEALSLALGPLYFGVESLRVSSRTADWLGWASLLIGVFSTTWTLMQSIWPVISHLFQ